MAAKKEQQKQAERFRQFTKKILEKEVLINVIDLIDSYQKQDKIDEGTRDRMIGYLLFSSSTHQEFAVFRHQGKVMVISMEDMDDLLIFLRHSKIVSRNRKQK